MAVAHWASIADHHKNPHRHMHTHTLTQMLHKQIVTERPAALPVILFMSDCFSLKRQVYEKTALSFEKKQHLSVQSGCGWCLNTDVSPGALKLTPYGRTLFSRA